MMKNSRRFLGFMSVGHLFVLQSSMKSIGGQFNSVKVHTPDLK